MEKLANQIYYTSGFPKMGITAGEATAQLAAKEIDFLKDGFRYSSLVMEPTQLTVEKLAGSDANRLILRLKGKLALETVHNFIQTVRPESAAQLILDMSEVSFLDSAGVGALVQIFVHRRHSGKSFALTGLSKQSNAVMQVAGLTKLLPIHNSVEEALAQRA